MSRIGKKSIPIPSGVEIKIDGQIVSAKGPKGELKQELPAVLEVKKNDDRISIEPKNKTLADREISKLWGLNRAIVSNMIKGVSEGFKKELEFSGVGFKAQVKGTDLELNLGYTNPVVIRGLNGVTFQVEKNTIAVSGLDKELVGRVAAEVRAARLPEPYKGTGIKYKGEVIRRKAGKKAVTTS